MVLVLLFIFATLFGTECELIVVLTYISLMANDVEHIFMCVYFIYVYLLQ